MNYYDALRTAAKNAGVPLTQIGTRLGKASTYVNGAISRGSVPTVDNASAMLAVCGYSLVAIPDSETLPDTAILLDVPASATPDALARRKRAEADAAERRAAQLRAEADALASN